MNWTQEFILNCIALAVCAVLLVGGVAIWLLASRHYGFADADTGAMLLMGIAIGWAAARMATRSQNQRHAFRAFQGNLDLLIRSVQVQESEQSHKRVMIQ